MSDNKCGSRIPDARAAEIVCGDLRPEMIVQFDGFSAALSAVSNP
ncbi:MAG: hypothetical protein WBV96_07950 [Polyangia bacterium]